MTVPRFIFSRDLRKLVGLMVGSRGISGVLNLITSLLIVRYLGAELYGGYLYFESLVAIAPALYGDLSQVLVRYLPEVSDHAERRRVFFGVALVQVLVALTVLVAAGVLFWVLPSTRVWVTHLDVNGISLRWVAVLVLLRLPMRLMIQWLTQYAAGMQRIGIAEAINTATQLTRLVGIGGIVATGATWPVGLAWIAWTELLALVATCGAWIVMHWRWRELFAGPRDVRGVDVPRALRAVSHRLIRYGVPLQLQGAAALAKNYLPVLLLGQAGLYGETATYYVVWRVVRVANHLLPDLFDRLLPQVVASRQRSPSVLARQFAALAWSECAFTIVCAWALVIAAEWWLGLFALAWTAHTRELVLLCTSALTLLGAVHPLNWELRLSHTTAPLLAIALIRTVVTLMLMAWLFPVDSMVMAQIELLGAVISAVIMLATSTHLAQLSGRTAWLRAGVSVAASPALLLFLR